MRQPSYLTGRNKIKLLLLKWDLFLSAKACRIHLWWYADQHDFKGYQTVSSHPMHVVCLTKEDASCSHPSCIHWAQTGQWVVACRKLWSFFTASDPGSLDIAVTVDWALKRSCSTASDPCRPDTAVTVDWALNRSFFFYSIRLLLPWYSCHIRLSIEPVMFYNIRPLSPWYSCHSWLNVEPVIFWQH